MNCDNTYNPIRRPTRWERFQAWVWSAYGVDAGHMIGAMASGFIGIVALGVMAVAQL